MRVTENGAAPKSVPVVGIRPSLGLLCTKEAARLLKLSHRTLEKWRGTGEGPSYCRVGGRNIRYRPEDINLFIEGQQQRDAQGWAA
ncbi:helix-turn-helix domain-containing protein [uncultured Brevundimonas sp.]|uniref:helix-turn-helix transcriptional regulator n=1 Tax=uncultured Brevundimonas sp. TaxID=213418 RepID=UPI00261C6A80|nr:helix-turn-helix domain-containing protein [uncultured Brevundimonas sp.]